MTSPAAPRATFADYLELTKPRLSLLSVLTALVGFAVERPYAGLRLLGWLALGTSLAAGGVAVLNQYLEHETDAKMRRTAQRPIPSGRITTGSAFVLGALMCAAALMILLGEVNALAFLFALLTLFSYLGWYTPAKRSSRWSTEIGALAGAFPPLIGTAAAAGRITPLGWSLFGVLLFWQIPHFMAVAWMHREDYTAVHFPLLPVRDASGRSAAIWSLIATLALIVCSLLPSFLGLTGLGYTLVAAIAGLWILARAVVFLRPEGRDPAARKLFLASIGYLPLVLAGLVAARLWRG